MESDYLTDSEKELLTALGKYPDTPIEELLTHISYKWTSTVVKKINYFRKQSLLWGPLYDVNYDKLCKNPLHKLFCILEITEDYRELFPYLELIEPYAWLFPVLSPHREFLIMCYYSTNDKETKALLQLLKDNGLITDYTVRTFCTKRIIENPNFFGGPTPSLDQLLSPCEVADMSLGHHDTDWNECDIRMLPYLVWGHGGEKLIGLLRKEKEYHRSWTYSQINYSREKMIRNGLIEKTYYILPFQLHHCTYFFLSLRTEDEDLTLRALYNFARGERIYKEYVLCEEEGLVFCVSHSSFLTELMSKLDQIREVTGKELYLLRSIWKSSPVARPPNLEYFDTETQKLEYPYKVYRERIKERIESEVG